MNATCGALLESAARCQCGTALLNPLIVSAARTKGPVCGWSLGPVKPEIHIHAQVFYPEKEGTKSKLKSAALHFTL